MNKEAPRLPWQGVELDWIYESAPIGLCFLDRNLHYLRINRALAEFNGAPIDAHIGRHVRDIVPQLADGIETLARLAETAREAQKHQIISGETMARPGVARSWETTWSPVFDAQGEIVGFGVIAEEVTERRRAEESLKRTTERFQMAQSAAGIGVWDWNLETGMTFLSHEWRCIFGVPDDGAQLDYEAFLQLVTAEDRPAVDEEMQNALGGGGAIHHEFRIRRASDGALRWVMSRGQVYFGGDGRPVRAMGAALDITGRKAVEEALKASASEARRQRDELDWIYQNAPIGLCLLDNELRYQRINHWLAEMNGCSVEAHIGRRVDEVVPDIAHFVEKAFRSVHETGVPLIDFEFAGETPSQPGARRYWNVSYYPVHDTQGAVTGAGAVVTETTETRRARALEEINRRKNEFLATLAHELRTPLASVRMALDLARARTGTDAETIEKNRLALEKADRNLGHLQRLVEELLTASRFAAGNIEIRKERVDLVAIVQEAAEANEPLLKAKGHRLCFDMPERPFLIAGDPLYLLQVFSNLVENAAKYSDACGRVDIAVAREGRDAVVSVRDSGVGIAKTDLPWLFQIFTRSGRHRTEKPLGGIGVGLAVVRTIVEKHGGDVSAQSEGEGRGAVFTVRLPV